MLTLVGIYLALVVNLMTSTTNATVFPAAAADIGGMDIYGLAQGVSGILSVCIMPIYGALGACRPALERILCGGSLMVGAAVLFVRGIAPSMIWIIASNVLWGLVSAGVFVLGFSMIRDMYDKVQAGVYLGMVGTMQSLGMLAGPFIGGLVIDHIGWRVFCFLLFALLALAGMFVLLGQRSFGEVPDSVNGKLGIDKLGAFAMVVFLGCFIIAVSMGTTWIPFGSIASTVLFVVAAVGLVVLVIDLRRKGSSAIVPLDALKDRNVMVFSCLNFFYNFGAMSLTFFVPGFVMTSMTGDSLVGFFAAWGGPDRALVLDEEDEVIRGVTVTLDGVGMWPPPPVKVSAAPKQAPAAAAAAAEPEEKKEKGFFAKHWWKALAAILGIALVVAAPASMQGHFVVFMLAIVVGFYVIGGVSHSLHTPLMSVTNAISGIIIVGAILQIGSADPVIQVLSFIAMVIASINIFGGFLVTRRMLKMFEGSSE